MRRKKRKKYLKYKKTFLAIVVSMFFILGFYYFVPNSFFIPDLSTHGFVNVVVEVEIREGDGLIKFSDDCYQISMIISKDQALSIQNGISGVISYRPNAHDLIKDTLDGLGVKILMVKITELKDNTYFAKLILKKGNLILSLDSRPSDAVAIAARVGYLVDIYVKEILLKTVGEKIC